MGEKRRYIEDILCVGTGDQTNMTATKYLKKHRERVKPFIFLLTVSLQSDIHFRAYGDLLISVPNLFLIDFCQQNKEELRCHCDSGSKCVFWNND